MHVYGLIEDNVLDLSFCLADHVAQLVEVEEKELKLYSFVLEKLDVISPISVVF